MVLNNMPEVYVIPVSSDKSDARNIINLKYNDLIRSGLDSNRALSIANPNINKHCDEQIEKISKRVSMQRYLGAFAVGQSEKMLGFMDACGLENCEKMPIDNIIWEISARFRSLLKNNSFIINSLIINSMSDSYKEAVNVLLDNAVKIAGEREIYIAIDQKNPAKAVIENKGFEPTGVYGKSDHIKKELYIHLPYATDKNTGSNKVWVFGPEIKSVC